MLQRLQKVFTSASSSCFSKEQVLEKTVEEEAETSSFRQKENLPGQIQQSIQLQFGLQYRQMTQLNEHLHLSTFTFILMQPGTETNSLVAYGNFFFSSPLIV